MAEAKCWRYRVVDEMLRLVSYGRDTLNQALLFASSYREAYAKECWPSIAPLQCVDQQALKGRLIDAGADMNF